MHAFALVMGGLGLISLLFIHNQYLLILAHGLIRLDLGKRIGYSLRHFVQLYPGHQSGYLYWDS